MPVIESTQLVHADLPTVWSFFSDPSNLTVITPPDMGFIIKFPKHRTPMYAGMIIEYMVSPLFSIPLSWVTEITQVKEHRFFVDTQLKGPFRIWHHQHICNEVGEMTEMTDIVTYELPFGKLGQLVAGRIVAKRVAEIFKYRYSVVERIFNK